VFRQMLLTKHLRIALDALKKLSHGSVGGTSLFSGVAGNSVLNVHGDGMTLLAEVCGIRPLDFCHLTSSFIDFLGDIEALTSVNFGDLHHVESKGASLVGANVIGAAHDFTG